MNHSLAKTLFLLAIVSIVKGFGINHNGVSESAAKAVRNAAAGAALVAALSTAEPAVASPTDTEISLNSFPPTTVELNLDSVPVLGKKLSGTYGIVPAEGSGAIVVEAPSDLVATAKKFLLSGKLGLDVGGLVSTHVNVDIAADEPGTATIKVQSPLIPQLPFENSASVNPYKGGDESPWYQVTNMGDGSTYYFNKQTDVTQYEKPTM